MPRYLLIASRHSEADAAVTERRNVIATTFGILRFSVDVQKLNSKQTWDLDLACYINWFLWHHKTNLARRVCKTRKQPCLGQQLNHDDLPRLRHPEGAPHGFPYEKINIWSKVTKNLRKQNGFWRPLQIHLKPMNKSCKINILRGAPHG